MPDDTQLQQNLQHEHQAIERESQESMRAGAEVPLINSIAKLQKELAEISFHEGALAARRSREDLQKEIRKLREGIPIVVKDKSEGGGNDGSAN